MAAVYTAKGGILQANDRLPSENKQPGAQHAGVAFLNNTIEVKVEDSGDGDLRLGGPVPSKHHAEVVEMNAVPPITIKEERVEDEDEYVEIQLGDVEATSEERTANNGVLSDDRDESIDGDWQFRCVDCGEAFGDKEAYLEHRREHTHDGPIVCLDTDSQWDDLLVSEDGGRRTLCCALCGRKFSSSKGFFTHQLKHHNQTLKQEPTASLGLGVVKQRFECEDCGKTYTSVGQCLNHQRSHKQASKSVFHQLAHLKKKSFKCPTCGRCYSRASALDAHRRCHEVKLVKSRISGTVKPEVTQEAPVGNESADKTPELPDKSQKKLYQCLCGRSFRTSCGLSTHQRFSANCKGLVSEVIKEEPKRTFNCSECGKSFISCIALACHQRWHRRRAQLRSSGQSFTCEECGRVFTSLTFYHKHQRLAHNAETPAKSFLHQVCQLQKKAFECQDCGRRFSRASALQSHQLCHADVYGDVTEKDAQTPSTTRPQKLYLCDKEKARSFAIGAMAYSQNTSQTLMEKDLSCSETGGIVAETGDFNVEVVSVTASDDSEGDDGPQEDPNPDLELVCESDQEEKVEMDASLSQTSPLQHKPEVDVKIVQMDYEPLDDQAVREMEMVKEKSLPQENKNFECPECGRTFAKAGSLRCHRLWHRGGMGKKARFQRKFRKGTPIVRRFIHCEICGHESHTKTAHDQHLRKHEDRKPYKSVMYQLAGLQKNNIKCEECGMRFSRVSALHSHQQHHTNVKKPFACQQCNKSYSNSSGLYNHRRTCSAWRLSRENVTNVKKEAFNPKKSLLGPKVYHCKRCRKGFWTLGALSHHKQYQSQCADVKEKSSLPESSQPVNGRIKPRLTPCPICGAVFRRRGSLVSHMMSHKQESKDSEKHKCEVCGKSYRLLTCFLKHQLVHDDAQLLPPPAKSFDHQVEQVKKNTYSCPDCGKLFSRAMALQFHMKSHGYETGYPFSSSSKSLPMAKGPQCPTCSAHFSSEFMLRCHQKRCGKRKEVDEGRVQEKEGPEKLIELPAKGDTDGQKPLNETINDNVSKTLQKSSLPNPVDLKYKCRDCARSFAVVGALNFHKRIHLQGHTRKDNSKSKNTRPQKVAKMRPEERAGKAPYICLECGRKFTSNSALGTHRRWHTDKKFAGFLSKDGKTCSVKKSLDDGPFLCNLCGKGFFYLCVLRRHQLHHPRIEAQPEVEPKTDIPAESKSNPSTSYLACPECGDTFSGGSLLAAHFESHHVKSPAAPDPQKPQSQVPSDGKASSQPGEPTPSAPKTSPTKKPKLKLKLHQCPECSKSYLKIRSLRAHKWQAHKKSKTPTPPTMGPLKPFPCTDCEKSYSSQGALYNHRRACRVAKKELKPPVAVVQEPPPSPPHRPLEQTSKCFFKCDKCGKAFPSEDQLEAHKEVAKTRPHCCALCCRGFWTETQLQQHLVWHDEVRRRLPTELRYRLSASVSSGPSAKPQASPRHPGTNSTPPVKAPPVSPAGPRSQRGHKCEHCGKAFLSPLALQQHQALHKGEDPYHCSLCPRTFSEIRDLIDHHQECLGDKEQRDSYLATLPRDIEGLSCIECGMSFSHETELHQHYIEHARGEF